MAAAKDILRYFIASVLPPSVAVAAWLFPDPLARWGVPWHAKEIFPWLLPVAALASIAYVISLSVRGLLAKKALWLVLFALTANGALSFYLGTVVASTRFNQNHDSPGEQQTRLRGKLDLAGYCIRQFGEGFTIEVKGSYYCTSLKKSHEIDLEEACSEMFGGGAPDIDPLDLSVICK